MNATTDKIYSAALSEFQAKLVSEVQAAGQLTLADVMRLIAEAHRRLNAKKEN